MQEYCYVMIKPGFANNIELINDVKNELTKLNLKIIKSQKIRYDIKSAKQHYIAKANETYYDELTNYITSDFSYGIVVKGENAITLSRQKIEELRISLKQKYNLDTNLTKNILHCTSKKMIDNFMVDIDSKREIKLFNELCKAQ